MRKSLLFLFMSFLLIGLTSIKAQEGAVDKKPLIEVFTASTCPPCVGGNLAIDGVLAQYPGQYSLVKYQMNWPGSGDPYYLTESAVRKEYYEVTGVPHMRSNGFIPHTPNWYPQSWVVADFENLTAKTNISITAEASVDETMLVTSHVEIKAHAAYENGLRAYIIVVESNTFDNVGTNGETEFHNVVMGFLSGSEGIQLGELEADQVLTYDLSIDLSGSFCETGNDLKVVVFVQNHATTMVEQSEMVEVSHPFVDYSATFNIYDDGYNRLNEGSIHVEKGGKALISDSKAMLEKLLPNTYYYEIIVPGLFPYEGEFTISDTNVDQEIILEVPPFLHYEDFERAGFPPGWKVYNPLEEYFSTYNGKIVFQKTSESEDGMFFTLPKVALDQGCVLSFKAGESSGRSNVAVGVVTDPEDPMASFTEIISYEVFGFENMRTFGARIDDPAAVGDGYLCFKINGAGGAFFYLDNVILIENMPGYKVQFVVRDQNNEVLPEVEITFMEETLTTNDFGYASWRNIDEAEYSYSVSYKGEEIETGMLDVYDNTLKEIVWNTTGIEEIIASRIEVYPNPAGDQITIKGVENATLSIMTLEGQIMKTEKLINDTRIETGDLAEGIYLLRIETLKETNITKLIIAR